MNGIPMNMFDTVMSRVNLKGMQMQPIQPQLQQMQPQVQQPQAQQPQQQYPDPSVAVNKIIERFAQHLEKEKKAGRLRVEQYGEIKRGLGTQLEQAGKKYAEPYKMGAKDYAALIASIALPVIGALQKRGTGRRGERATQRRQQMWTGLGQAAGAIGQGFQAQHGQQQEREFAGAKESIGYQSGLADMGYATQEGQAATQLRGTGDLTELQLGAVPQVPEGPKPMGEYQAGTLGLARDKFEYGKTQDARAFDTKVTDQYNQYGAGPWKPGQAPWGPGAQQRREAEAAYQRAATWLIQEMSRETGGNVEEREARLQQALTQLRQLYGLDPDPSMEIPVGGSRGIQTPAEKMGMGGQPSLIDIDEELRRRGVNVGP